MDYYMNIVTKIDFLLFLKSIMSVPMFLLLLFIVGVKHIRILIFFIHLYCIINWASYNNYEYYNAINELRECEGDGEESRVGDLLGL